MFDSEKRKNLISSDGIFSKIKILLKFFTLIIPIIALFGPLINHYFEYELESLLNITPDFNIKTNLTSELDLSFIIPPNARKSYTNSTMEFIVKQGKTFINNFTIIDLKENSSVYVPNNGITRINIAAMHPGTEKLFAIRFAESIKIDSLEVIATLYSEHEPLNQNYWNFRELKLSKETIHDEFISSPVYILLVFAVAMIIFYNLSLQKKIKRNQEERAELLRKLKVYEEQYR